jgi:hypothetical protein
MTRRPGWVPTARNELLLRAALGEGDEAVEAWKAWKAQVALDDYDYAEGQLLSLLFRNLNAIGVEDEDIGRLRGVYRFNWSRNHLVELTAAAALDVLSDAGIETMVLKGLPLSVLHYRDMGVREMLDSDILVPRERAAEAIEAMRRQFEPFYPDPESKLPIHHSTPFKHPDGGELDLHWYALWQSSPDDDFWEASVPVEISRRQTRALCPTDELLHLCAHGPGLGDAPQLRWVADAAAVMRSSGTELDWARLVEQARRRRLTLTVSAPLAYLRDTIGLPVPAEVLDELAAFPAPRFERVAQRALSGRARRLGVASLQWDRHRRLALLDPGAPRGFSFRSQVQGFLGPDSSVGLSLRRMRRLVRSDR